MPAALKERRPVSKELWRQLQPLIPAFVPSAKGGARKLAVSDEAALNGILFVLQTGIPCEHLLQSLGHNSKMFERCVDAIPAIAGLGGRPRKRPSKLHADKGYDYKRCRALLRQALRARPRRRGLPKDRGARGAVADNVLDRQFQADGPNQKWVADFTYIWTAEGWLYVAAVLDLYSRRIVGWSMQESMTSQLVVDALMMAVWRRGRPVALCTTRTRVDAAIGQRLGLHHACCLRGPASAGCRLPQLLATSRW